MTAETTWTDRSSEPDDEFEAVLAKFEAAPAAEESLRERVARAIFAVANPIVEALPDYWERVTGGEMTRSAYRRQADAALAVVRGES